MLSRRLYCQCWSGRDLAAFRTRAFGLAILGDEQDAVSIVQTVMPGKLSDRIVPYLRYMPRLTAAQQAAAGNLGIFPKAARIGRDDSRIANYATSSAPMVQSADTRLAPTGTPLGPQSAATTDRSSRSVTLAQPRTEPARSPRMARSQWREASDAMTRIRRQRNASAQVPQTASTVVSAATETATAPLSTPQPVVISAAADEPPASSSNGPVPSVIAAPSSSSATAIPPTGLASAPSQKPAPAGPGFDLGSPPNSSISDAAIAAPAVQSVPAPSVADAFAAFASPKPVTVPPAADVVDITAIRPPVERSVVARGELAKPVHPSRIWVQVATGLDRLALALRLAAHDAHGARDARRCEALCRGLGPDQPLADWPL